MERPGLGERAAGGGLGGALATFLMARKPTALKALLGGAGGAAANTIGFGAAGEDNPIAGNIGSGALFGAGAGTAAVGSAPGGMSLVKSLMQRGVPLNKARAMILGAGAGVGTGIGVLGGGLNAALEEAVHGE